MDASDTSADLPYESPFPPAHTPRISILHLMLWTLCSAIYLSLIRAIHALQGDMPDGYAAMQDATSVIQGMITGAVLTGAIVLVPMRIRNGPPMLRQPGHWLLFVSAISSLIYLTFLFLALLLRDGVQRGTSVLIIYGAISLFPAIAYGFAAYCTRVLSWKVLLMAFAAAGAMQCISYLAIGLVDGRPGSWFQFTSAIQSFGNLLLPLAILVVSIVDYVRGRRYDWLHWTGVITKVAGFGVALLWMIASWFLR